MNISTGLSEISFSRFSETSPVSNKTYIWPGYNQGKVQKMEGVATLKVKVEVLFFSKTVSVSVRRELKGADADPKFIEMIDEDDWQEYCLAFAE